MDGPALLILLIGLGLIALAFVLSVGRAGTRARRGRDRSDGGSAPVGAGSDGRRDPDPDRGDSSDGGSDGGDGGGGGD